MITFCRQERSTPHVGRSMVGHHATHVGPCAIEPKETYLVNPCYSVLASGQQLHGFAGLAHQHQGEEAGEPARLLLIYILCELLLI
jgi:hypothetical protein